MLGEARKWIINLLLTGIFLLPIKSFGLMITLYFSSYVCMIPVQDMKQYAYALLTPTD